METSKAINTIFDIWVLSLIGRDRSKRCIRPNVEELFQSWIDVGASFEDLYETWLPRAIKAHFPSQEVAKAFYVKVKMFKSAHLKKSESTFYKDWHTGIKDEITQVFLEYFPAPTLESSEGPKIYGSMSAREYGLQRKHADSYPILDTTELEKQWHAQDNTLDLEELIKQVMPASNGEQP